jgi:hypothetical protein
MPVQFRNVREPAETVGVSYGILGKRLAGPDGIITVEDWAAAAYECQPEFWQRLGVPAESKAPVSTPVVVETEPVAEVQPVVETPVEVEDTAAKEALLSQEIAALEAQKAELEQTEEVK